MVAKEVTTSEFHLRFNEKRLTQILKYRIF